MNVTVLKPPIQASDEQRENNDMIPESLCLMSVSLAAVYLGAGGDASMLAIPGAMLAALVALLKAANEKRAWQDRACSVIGTSVVGSTAPSAVVHYYWPDAYPKMIWQAWALFGFLGGLVGWIIAFAFVKAVGLRSDGIANNVIHRWGKKLSPSDTDSKDGRGGRP